MAIPPKGDPYITPTPVIPPKIGHGQPVVGATLVVACSPTPTHFHPLTWPSLGHGDPPKRRPLHNLDTCHSDRREESKPGFPILGVFRLNGQPKRDGSIIVRSCKATQSPVYPIRDAILAVNHASCPSLSSSGPRQWGESALKTSRLLGALSLLARSWLYPPSAWRRR